MPRNAWLKKPSSVKPNNGPAGRHDQEYTPRNSLKVAAETDNETRDKIYHARGIRLIHVLQVDDYWDFLATVLTDGGGIPKASETHYYGFDTVTHSKLATRGFIVVLNLTDVLGRIPVLFDLSVIIILGEAEPITSIALHHTGLRRYEPIHGRRQARLRLMTETSANQTAPNSNNGNRPQRINTPVPQSRSVTRRPGDPGMSGARLDTGAARAP
jgi:hypothetical protein